MSVDSDKVAINEKLTEKGAEFVFGSSVAVAENGYVRASEAIPPRPLASIDR